MNLELKHIAPYLPYGIKCEYFDTLSIKRNGILTGIDVNYGISVDHCYSLCVPYLRPLSELDTEILLDELLLKQSDAMHEWCNYFNSDNQNKHNAILKAEYSVLEYCFKNHFDVFGLIPKGLAYDINELKL